MANHKRKMHTDYSLSSLDFSDSLEIIFVSQDTFLIL